MISNYSFADLSDRIKKNDSSVLSDIDQLLNQNTGKSLSNSEKLDLLFLKASYLLLIKANYDEARNVALKGKALFKKNSNPVSESRIWRILGAVYQYQGKHSSAVTNYLKAISLLEQIPKKSLQEYQDLVGVYCNLGNIHSTNANDDSVLWFLRKAMRISENIKYAKGLDLTYKGLAAYYYNKNLYKRSLFYVLKGFKISTDLDDKRGLCYSTANIGDCLHKLKKYDQALKYYKKSLYLRISNGFESSLSSAYIKVAYTYADLKNYEKAIIYWKKGLKISKRVNSIQDLIQYYKLGYKISLAKSDSVFALKYFRLFHKYKLLDLQEVNNAAVNQIKVKNASDIAMAETLILRKKNDEIKDHLLKLEKINSDLIQFTHIASHDLKEPIRTVMMHLSLLQKRLQDTSYDFSDLISTAQSSSERLYQLIIGLSTFLDVNRVANSMESIDLNELAQDVLSSLDRFISEKNASVVVDKLPILYFEKMKMHILFQNMISNGIEFNESTKPVIKISYIIKGKKPYLIFKDNGIGVPQEYQDKVFEIFNRVSVEKPIQGIGLGLTICKKIIDQLNGTISIKHPEEGGTEFHLHIPTLKS